MPTDRRFREMFGVELLIIQAPMVGASDAEMAIAVSEAGGLGSLPCAMLTPDQVRTSFRDIQQRTTRPVNLNFFCHREPVPDATREGRWREQFVHYYTELGIDPSI